MDKIDAMLNTFATNASLTAAIRTSCSLGKKLLNKYYERTDSSEIYRIAMGKFSFIFRSYFYVLIYNFAM